MTKDAASASILIRSTKQSLSICPGEKAGALLMVAMVRLLHEAEQRQKERGMKNNGLMEMMDGLPRDPRKPRKVWLPSGKARGNEHGSPFSFQFRVWVRVGGLTPCGLGL
jgi:hypothetical protein